MAPLGKLAAPGTVSCRALFLAFLIHRSALPPLCWRRTELVLLAGCILGTPTLQKVAARTMQLALELGGLKDARLLWRFLDSSPPGAVTWDAWT